MIWLHYVSLWVLWIIIRIFHLTLVLNQKLTWFACLEPLTLNLDPWKFSAHKFCGRRDATFIIFCSPVNSVYSSCYNLFMWLLWSDALCICGIIEYTLNIVNRFIKYVIFSFKFLYQIIQEVPWMVVVFLISIGVWYNEHKEKINFWLGRIYIEN